MSVVLGEDTMTASSELRQSNSECRPERNQCLPSFIDPPISWTTQDSRTTHHSAALLRLQGPFTRETMSYSRTLIWAPNLHRAVDLGDPNSLLQSSGIPVGGNGNQRSSSGWADVRSGRAALSMQILI